VIVAGNHVTFVDSLFLGLVVRRQVFFIGKDEYVTGRGLKGRLMAWFFTTCGMIPVDRDGGHGGVAALMTGRRVLDEGKIFGIYPEGTRSPDGRLYRGRTGVGWLVLASGARVLPVALEGTEKIQPIGASRPRVFGPRPTVRIGPPMDFSHYRDLPPAKARRAITDEIVETIQKMSGQEYAHVYNERADEEQR
jgi:1-acyl-sn-glycerol-3-phosphate acyltransferase